MIFVHDIIKIKYINEGYIKNYPPSLLSDGDMVRAFMSYYDYDYRTPAEIRDGVTLSNDERWRRFLEGSEICYFRDNYPLIDPSLEAPYRKLVDSICSYLKEFLDSTEDEPVLPDWIYSYMLGVVIGPNSTQLDKHYMFVLLDVDNLMDDYDLRVATECYKVSTICINTLSKSSSRPPTMFGEPNVLKYLRVHKQL